MTMIPYGRQDINQADIDAVVAVLRSDFLTQGPAVPAFEKAVADYCGAQHAVAVNSATSALHIACLALGVGKGDSVWTTPITFVASANCALYCGATVDFVDIDPRTYNLSVERLAEKLALAEKTGNLPKVVIPVHLCGQPCDMAGIHALSQRYGFKIIEDASHAIGGKYKDEPIGNVRYSDITVFSHPVKIITSGEGGKVTNDATLAKHLRLLRSAASAAPQQTYNRPAQEIGITNRSTGFQLPPDRPQAALGLPNAAARCVCYPAPRRAKRYDQLLSSLRVTPWQQAGSYSGYLYVIRLKLNEINKTQRQVYDALRAAEILVNLHYIPVYRQPYYEQMGFNVGYCPQAEQYYSEVVSIPLYPGLTAVQQNSVVVALSEALA